MLENSYIVLGVADKKDRLLKEADLLLSERKTIQGNTVYDLKCVKADDVRMVSKNEIGKVIVLNTLMGETLFFSKTEFIEFFNASKFNIAHIEKESKVYIPSMVAWKRRGEVPSVLLRIDKDSVESDYYYYVTVFLPKCNIELNFMFNEGYAKCKKYLKDIPFSYIDIKELQKIVPIINETNRERYKSIGKDYFYGICCIANLPEFSEENYDISFWSKHMSEAQLKDVVYNQIGLKKDLEIYHMKTYEDVIGTGEVVFKIMLECTPKLIDKCKKTGTLLDVLENIREYCNEHPINFIEEIQWRI